MLNVVEGKGTYCGMVLDQCLLLSVAWAIGGNFNVIAASSEKIGGNPPDMIALNDFSDRILDCNLIGFIGLPFTWQRGVVKERLDIILFNQRWLDLFTVSTVKHGIRRNLIINPSC